METSTSLREVAGAPPESARAHGRLVALALLFSLFFLWGVANNLNDILIRQFKKAFELTDFQSGLVQSAFYLGYFLLALPAALFLRWRGYKAGIVLGLSLYAAGALLFYPAANARGYGFFLLALFVIASGLSFLETSANPYVTLLGPAHSAEQRLNFAQAFNPLGSITGVLIGRLFIFSGHEYTPEQLAGMSTAARDAYYAAESVAVQQPYLVIGLVVGLLALVFKLTPFPPTGPGHERPGTDLLQGFRALAGNRSFVVAVLAQFFYVGAQVGIWSYSIRYAQGTIPGTSEKTAADYLILSLVVFMIGRFVGTALMKGVAPARLLMMYALTNALLSAVAMAVPGHIGMWALIATSFFMSIMFPTIFALGLRKVGDARELASSFLVMAIIGGAILTPVMGAISGQMGIQWSMAVPLLAFAVVLGFAVSNRSTEA